MDSIFPYAYSPKTEIRHFRTSALPEQQASVTVGIEAIPLPDRLRIGKVLTEIVTRRECGNSIPWVLVRPTGIWGPWFDIPYRNFFDAVRRGVLRRLSIISV